MCSTGFIYVCVCVCVDTKYICAERDGTLQSAKEIAIY